MHIHARMTRRRRAATPLPQCVVDNGTIWEPYPTVMLGWPALNATKPPPNAEVHEVTRVIVHPDYMSGLAAAEAGGTLPPSDMALLVLDAPSALAPVLLPPRDFPLEEHTPVWAAGYRCGAAGCGGAGGGQRADHSARAGGCGHLAVLAHAQPEHPLQTAASPPPHPTPAATRARRLARSPPGSPPTP